MNLSSYFDMGVVNVCVCARVLACARVCVCVKIKKHITFLTSLPIFVKITIYLARPQTWIGLFRFSILVKDKISKAGF